MAFSSREGVSLRPCANADLMPSKDILVRLHRTFCSLLFDPLDILRRWRGLPYYFFNLCQWKTRNKDRRFRFSLADAWYTSYDRFLPAGMASGHYFHQDLWAARHLHARGVKWHIDVGSSLNFVAHVLPFCEVEQVDLRPLESDVSGVTHKKGSILNLPYGEDSIDSLSCLHVIEHIGLGRYGDPVDPDGHVKAASEMVRVLKPGGILLLGTPVGRERLCFDAHRIFNPETVVSMFRGLKLIEFSLIDDKGNAPTPDADFKRSEECRYGCGLFVFTKFVFTKEEQQ